MKYTPPRPFKKIPKQFSPQAQKLFENAVWRGEQNMLKALHPVSMQSSRKWLLAMSKMLDAIARSAMMKRMFYDFIDDAIFSFRPYQASVAEARSLLWLNLYATKAMVRAREKSER